MPKTEIHHPEKAVSTGAYSAGVEIDGWVYVSGQASVDLKTGAVIRGTIEEETTRTLENVEKILRAVGCSRADIVKCAAHLSDIADFPRYDAAYRAFFADALPFPARTTVQSGLTDGILVEIDSVARKPRVTSEKG